MAHDNRRLVTAPSSVELLVHTLTLQELIEGARDALRSHVGELQRRFGPELLRRIGAQDSTVTADAILSDVFMRLPDALVGYEDDGRFEAWLWVIARNVLRDRQRGRRRLPDQFPHSDFEVAARDAPARSVERADLIERLGACLAPRQREVWLLNMSGYSDQEVARELDLTPNNVAQLLFRARKRLREEAQRLGLRRSDILTTGLSREFP